MMKDRERPPGPGSVLYREAMVLTTLIRLLSDENRSELTILSRLTLARHAIGQEMYQVIESLVD